MRSRKRRAFLLASAAASAVVLAFAATPASAEKHTLLVTLLGGSQITVTVDVPPGTPVDQIKIPGVTLPVVGVQDITPAPTTSTTTTPTTSTPTETTPTTKTTKTTTTTTTTTKTTTTKTTPQKPAGGGDHSSSGSGHTHSSTGSTPKQKTGSKSKSTHKTKARHEHKGSDKAALQKAAKKPHTPRDKGGAPTADNPTFSFASPGPAAIGVPNFFIDRFRVPPFLLSIYQAAGTQYGIPWQVLAGINEIETDYGRNLNVSTAGAVGWMQFLPSTWRTWGVDANNDGRKDPYNPVDAIFAAARYLKAAGGDKDIKKAIFAYNHAGWYVQSVLLRARLLGGLPADLIGSLTGLTQGQFPIAAKAKYADDIDEAHATRRITHGNAAQPVDSSARTGIDIYSRKGAKVIATQDGKILKTGTNHRLGRYVVLQDVYGNRYTYGNLGSVSQYYPVPKEQAVSKASLAKQLHLPEKEKAPTTAATAGVQRAPAKSAKSAARTAPAKSTTTHAQAGPRAVTKQRLFAHPARPANAAHGGRRQLVRKPKFTTFKDYFTVALGLKRRDVTLKPLRAGSQVIAGTVLGRIGDTVPNTDPHLHFEIRPAGKGAPRIDPKPILDGWKLLEATAVYRAAGKNPFLGGTNPTAGQVLLMSKETLQRRVLNDPHVKIYPCGRQDIAAGVIDRRVLATLEFLVANGLNPTVSALKCGHSYLTTSGNVSEHSSGNAVDIAMINGIPIAGHQGPGSITDITIRRLLTLQGVMKPHQIISLMTFRGADNTLALPDHWNHIHVGFHPEGGQSGKLGREVSAILKPAEWTKLVDRLGEIQNPVVSVKPSKYAIKDRRTGSGD